LKIISIIKNINIKEYKMKKETQIGIAKWIAEGDIGISSKAVLTAFMIGKAKINTINFDSSTPSDYSDFNRIYKLIKYAPEVKNGIKILSNISISWKNIYKFWDELVFVFENKNIEKNCNTTFYDFLSAIINKKYSNRNYQEKYDKRYKRGKEIYKLYNFSGKRLPNKIKSL